MAILEAAASAGASASAGAITFRRPLTQPHMAPNPDNDLPALRAQLLRARLTGVERTQHGDKMVVYKDDAQMAAALAAADQMIANVGRPAIRTIVFNCSKGLE